MSNKYLDKTPVTLAGWMKGYRDGSYELEDVVEFVHTTIRKQAIEDCVNLLKIQHEAAKEKHNYFLVAAQLLKAEFSPKHNTDSDDCWCNPTVTYEHPITGVKVLVHKDL